MEMEVGGRVCAGIEKKEAERGKRAERRIKYQKGY